MRNQTEYLNSNTAIAFPFCENAAGLRYANGTTGLPLNIFVDAAFEVPYSFAPSKRLYLMTCSSVDGQSLIIEIGDGSSSLISVSLIAAETYTLGTGTSNGLMVRILADSAALISYATEIAGTVVSFGTSLPFEPSTQDVINPGVQSFAIYNHGPDEAPDATGITGDVQLLSGYNIDLAIVDAVANDITPVGISAIPGAGRGRLPCEEQVEVKGNVPPGMSPNKGNIQIQGDECYAVVPHPGTGTIQLQGHCQACCTCDDYTDMLNILKDLCARAEVIKTTLTEGRNQYELGVTEFNKYIAPQYTRVSMKANGMRGSDWGTGHPDRGAPNWARIVIEFNNRRLDTATVTSWSIDFIDPSEVIVEDVAWEYNGTGDKTTIGGILPDIEHDKTLAITILVGCKLLAWTNSGGKWRMEITARTTAGGKIDDHSQLLEFG